MRPAERMQKVLDYLGIGTIALATKVGLTRTRIRDLIRNDAKMAPDVADAISKNYPIISKNWLLYEEGEMLVKPEIKEIMSSKEVMEFILQREGISGLELCRQLGMGNDTIRSITSGKTKSISPKLAHAIVEIFPHYNELWILTGEGEPCPRETQKEPTLEDSFLKIVNAQLATNALLQEEINELKAQHNQMQARSEAMHREFMVAVKVLNQLGAHLNIPNDYQLASEPKPADPTAPDKA